MVDKYEAFISKAKELLINNTKKKEAPNDILITTMVLLCMCVGYGTLAGMAVLSLL